jgi:hypothetical protein
MPGRGAISLYSVLLRRRTGQETAPATGEIEMSKKRERRKAEEDEKELEEGLENTFPASDPPAVTEPHHREPPQPR